MRDLMGYGSFFFGSAVLLVLLAFGIRALGRSQFGSAAWRSRLINAALVLLAVLAVLVAAEGCFLFFVDTTDNALSTLTSRRWVERHLPLPLWTYRGRRSPSPDAGTRPTLFIAVLGDSITYGQGVKRDEDLYPSLLERELRGRGVAIDVYNLSAPGWNTGEELRELLKEFEAGATFQAVVLGFCLNDIGTFVEAAPGFHEAVARIQTPPAALIPLVDNSFVASFLYNRYVSLTSPVIGATWKRLAEAYREPGSFAALAAQLEGFKRLTDHHGVPLLVATFPDTTTAWERYPYRDIHRQLDAFWRRLGVTHVDLLPAFEKHPARSLQVGILDAHPNELAHRLAAAELAAAMSKLVGPLPSGRGVVAEKIRP